MTWGSSKQVVSRCPSPVFLNLVFLSLMFPSVLAPALSSQAPDSHPPATDSAAIPATIKVEFSNTNLVPPHWVMVIHEDGSGEFSAERSDSLTETAQIAPGAIHRAIQLSPRFASQVFATARNRRLFDFPCESHLKVAFQGAKRFTYTGPDGNGSCEYNYSRDKEIQALGDSILAVAYTLIDGARLEKLLQHDRLGLDLATENLVTAAHEGNAQELGVIRETLERIANDDTVLERARKRARLLLALAH